MIRVLVATDDPPVAARVRSALDQTADCRVAGEARDAGGLEEALSRVKPDVLILGRWLPLEDETVLARLAEAHPECRVLVMVDQADEHCPLRAIPASAQAWHLADDVMEKLKGCRLAELGAAGRGCIPRSASAECFAEALRRVAAGGRWAGPSFAGCRLASSPPSPEGREKP